MTSIAPSNQNISSRASKFSSLLAVALVVLSIFSAAVTVCRLLYELFFPRLLWLGRPLPTILVAVLLTILTWGLVRPAIRRMQPQTAIITFLPLNLNLLYLFRPNVQSTSARFIFFSVLWLVMVLILRHAYPHRNNWSWLGLLFLLIMPIYVVTMGTDFGSADTFEFQVTAPNLGIAHPTGYPLYLIFGKLWTLLPVGTIAFRLNLGSVVYGLVTLALIFHVVRHTFNVPIPGIIAAVAFALLPTFWSQAIEAEVYALHAIFVAGALLQLVHILLLADGYDHANPPSSRWYNLRFLFILGAFWVGLGLTNHLTTVLLVPAAGLTFLFVNPQPRLWVKHMSLGKMVSAFLAPLLLYTYLPIRWQAVNGEAMGVGRWFEWVTGSRFQDALQWMAWLRDPTRYEIIGRLFLSEWGSFGLVFVLAGCVCLFLWHWRIALIVAVTWVAYTFYCLNYYVPDLNVFLLPAHLCMAIMLGSGPAFAAIVMRDRPNLVAVYLPVTGLLTVCLLWTALFDAPQNWVRLDRSGPNPLRQWGEAALASVPNDGVILADSDKFPPLFYLKQAEGIRPNLDIKVLPDEAAYRQELDAQTAAGERVYLARFLPRLPYFLSSAGPLVLTEPQNLSEPPSVETAFGSIEYFPFPTAVEAFSTEPNSYARYLGWQATAPIDQNLLLYRRWNGAEFVSDIDVSLAVNNSFPTNAWPVGMPIPDFVEIAQPVLPFAHRVDFEAAWAPAFTHPDELEWQTLFSEEFEATESAETNTPIFAQVGPVTLSGIDMPAVVRPEETFTVRLAGTHSTNAEAMRKLTLFLQPVGRNLPVVQARNSGSPSAASTAIPFAWDYPLTAAVPTGEYDVIASFEGLSSACGWLVSEAGGCSLGRIFVQGVPIPANATNFGDLIALLGVDTVSAELTPGSVWTVELEWQALNAIPEDYTVFVQVLDEQDNIVGQTDSWPVQGTFPTSQWQVGDVVNDPVEVQLSADMSPGQYKLFVGLYSLRDLQRIAVVDASGNAIDDKFAIPTLFVSE